MESEKITLGLSGNVLKALAAISMVIDHVGVMIFPQNELLRIIGRLAFPIFSYMICEGCRHTRNRLSYLLKILILGIVTTAIASVAEGELYFDTLITFSCSITLILLLTKSRESKNKIGRALFRLSFLAVFYVKIHRRLRILRHNAAGLSLGCRGNFLIKKEKAPPVFHRLLGLWHRTCVAVP